MSAQEQRPILIDLAGGDLGPKQVIKAVELALAEQLGPLVLVGSQDQWQQVPSDLAKKLDFLESTEEIGMHESPARAARSKKQSSMHVGMRAVKESQGAAFVTAGNSGAALAVGLITLKRLKGCERPAIASILPAAQGEIVLLDLGANTEVRPAQFAQFAVLGEAYSRLYTKIERPRVGLLSNGTELTKGTEALRTAHQLLSITDLNYIGFVEANSIPLGKCDVIVTDGFTGNIALKLTEGLVEGIGQRLTTHLSKSLKGRLLGTLLKVSLKRFKSEIDWRQFGGAPILGLNGLVVVSHGRSDAFAFCSAIRQARRAIDYKLLDHLGSALESTPYSGRVSSTSELAIFPISSSDA